MLTPRRRTVYDWVIEIISLASLLWSCYPLLFYNKLSNDVMIPIHYNLKGEIDGWGGRDFLWILPLIAIVLYIGLTLIEKNHKNANYPFKVTKENADFIYRLRIRLYRHLKLFSVLIFSYLNNSSYAIAIGNESDLNKFVMLFLMGGAFMSVAIFYIKMHLIK